MKEERSPYGRHRDPTRASRPGRWLVVTSPLLDGEAIVILRHPAFARAARRAYPDLVIYAPAEVEVLQEHRSRPGYEALFRQVHLLKKTFDGVVIPTPGGAGAAPLAMVPTDDGCGSGSPERPGVET